MDALKIPKIIKAVLAPQSEGAGVRLAALKPGDQLSALVLKIENDGSVLVDLGSRRVLAQIGFPVKPGQNLQLQVIKAGPLLHLKAENLLTDIKAQLPSPTTDFSQILNAKEQKELIHIAAKAIVSHPRNGSSEGLPQNIRNALSQIKTFFETIPMERSSEQISRWVKTAVENRGVLFEKQLADLDTATPGNRPQPHGNMPLSDEPQMKIPPERIVITRDIKSNLIQLKAFFNHTDPQERMMDRLDPKEQAFMRKTVERMLGHVEQQQDRAVARWRDGDNHQMIIHALPLPDQQKPVRIKMYYPRKGESSKKDRQHRVALLLDMDRLGAVRVDLSMADRQLQIGFYVDRPEIQQQITQRVHDVEAALGPHFENILINVSVSREKISQFEKDDLIPGDAGKISIKV